MMKEVLAKRLSAFCSSLIFSKQDLWGNSDVVVIHSQKQTNPDSLSSKFYLWLVGDELEDTTTIFTSSAIYFFSTEKNYFLIRSLCCFATLITKITVSVQLKKNNDDGFALIDATIRNARLIRNDKGFNSVFGADDGGSRPFFLGYIEGECPMSKLFLSCLSNLEPRKFRAVSVNTGVSKMINTGDQPNFGFFATGAFGDKSAEFVPPGQIFGPSGKDKGVVKTTKDLKDEEQRGLMKAMEKNSLESKFEHIGLGERGRRSNLGSDSSAEFVPPVFAFGPPRKEKGILETTKDLIKEKNSLESKFERIGLSEKGRRSNLGSDEDRGGLGKLVSRVNENPLPTTKTSENVSRMMGNLNLSNCLDGGKKDNSKAENKDGDQVFKFGASKLGGEDGKSMEGMVNGDQLLKSGEGKIDCDELFKLGEGQKDGDQQFKIGGKRARNPQPQLMEENKGAKDVKLLTERLTAFYSSWRIYKKAQWQEADVLVITTQSVGPFDSCSHPVSSSFLVWLLDDEFPETTVVFTDSGIEFLCTNESFFRLRSMGIRMTKVSKLTVSVQLKKRGEQCFDWLKSTLCKVKTAPKSGANWCPLVVGCISTECREIDVLSRSRMFEVAYINDALANLLQPESFAAPQSTLPKQFQRLSLGTCDAKAANALLLSEIAKMKSMDDSSYVSQISDEEMLLLEKIGDTLSSLLADDIVDNGGQVQQSKPEENKVLEEDSSSRNLADKIMLLDIKEGDMDTSITEAGAEEKLFTEEQNMLSNSENSPIPQVEECGEQSRPTAEGGMDYSVQPTDVTDAAAENSLPDDNNGSPRKDSVGSDREDDDWTLVEMGCEGQEAEVTERVSWKRWFMSKTVKPFGVGVKEEAASDEAPSKRTKSDA